MSARVLAILVAVTVLANAWFLAPAGPGFPLDDAWVHMVYARSVAGLEGFAFNPGEAEAGVTAPLWTLLLAVPEAIWTHVLGESRADAGARALGGLFGLLTAWAGFRLASRAGRWPAVFAAILLTLDPLMMFTRFSGMELPLFGMLSLLFVEALLDNRAGRAGWLAGLLCLTRPEALVLVVVGLVFFALRRVRVWPYLLPIVICIGPWVAYCQYAAGHPLPNTLLIKGQWILDVFVDGHFVLGDVLAHLWNVTGALIADTGWGWALVLALIAGAISLNGGFRLLGTMQLVAALTLFGAILVTRTWEFERVDGVERIPFYWGRYALVCWPLMLVVVSAGIGSLVRTAYAGFFCRLGAAVALIGPLLLILGLAYALPGKAFELRQRFADQCAQVELQQVAAGIWIDANLPPDVVVAAHDAGAVNYFGKRRVFDFYGNNDGELAHLLSGGDTASLIEAEKHLNAMQPDALVCFPLLYASRLARPEVERLEARFTASGETEFWEHNYVGILNMGLPYATRWGLTRRVATFSVERSATMDTLLHLDMAIFVRPPQ